MDLDGAHDSASSQQLPPALQLHILSFLPPNERALSGRLVSPDAADALTGPDHCTASLSQPLPPHSAPWAVEAGQKHVWELPFWHKMQLPCTAAASGSEVNLEVALALLQPSVIPELLQSWDTYAGPDPGVSALMAGQPQLLGWLLRRCPGLLHPGHLLQAAAHRCDLAGMKAVWEAVGSHPECGDGGSGGIPNGHRWHQVMLDAAAASVTNDGPEKMRWLLATCKETCELQDTTAVAAACSGDLGRLHWLHSSGCPMDDQELLSCALQHADLAVAQWLVDEAGCELPGEGVAEDPRWASLLKSAVRSPGGVEKLAWLQERGAPSPTAELLKDAVDAGQAALASCLLQAPQAASELQARGQELGLAAVASHSIPTVEVLWGAGVRFTHEAYVHAAGSLAMTRWLACHAEVPAAGLALDRLIYNWPRATPAHSRELLQAVRLLVGQAGGREPPVDYGAALEAAAQRGDLPLVQYLVQQQQQQVGQPEFQPDEDFVAAVAVGQSEPLLEWLAANYPSCVGVADSQDTPYRPAARSGDLATLTALRRLGVPWGADDLVARLLMGACTVPVLRWLVEQGAPVGSAKDMETAVIWGKLQHRLKEADTAWLRGLVPEGEALGILT